MSFWDNVPKEISDPVLIFFGAVVVGVVLSLHDWWRRRNLSKKEIRIMDMKRTRRMAQILIILTLIGGPLLLYFVDDFEGWMDLIDIYVGICCGFLLSIAVLSGTKEIRNEVGLELLTEGEEIRNSPPSPPLVIGIEVLATRSFIRKGFIRYVLPTVIIVETIKWKTGFLDQITGWVGMICFFWGATYIGTFIWTIPKQLNKGEYTPEFKIPAEAEVDADTPFESE
jgi:MFS family permease